MIYGITTSKTRIAAMLLYFNVAVDIPASNPPITVWGRGPLRSKEDGQDDDVTARKHRQITEHS